MDAAMIQRKFVIVKSKKFFELIEHLLFSYEYIQFINNYNY